MWSGINSQHLLALMLFLMIVGKLFHIPYAEAVSAQTQAS